MREIVFATNVAKSSTTVTHYYGQCALSFSEGMPCNRDKQNYSKNQTLIYFFIIIDGTAANFVVEERRFAEVVDEALYCFQVQSNKKGALGIMQKAQATCGVYHR